MMESFAKLVLHGMFRYPPLNTHDPNPVPSLPQPDSTTPALDLGQC